MSLTLLIAIIALVIMGILLGGLLFQPKKLLFRLVTNSVIGLVILWLINFAGAYVGFNIPLNFITVIIAGAMGVPGLVMLVGIEWLVR